MPPCFFSATKATEGHSLVQKGLGALNQCASYSTHLEVVQRRLHVRPMSALVPDWPPSWGYCMVDGTQWLPAHPLNRLHISFNLSSFVPAFNAKQMHVRCGLDVD